jgi:serine/threonine-protein kinase
MPVCPKCNLVFDEGFKFCKADGTALIPLTAETHLPLGSLVNESLRVLERIRQDRFGVVYRVEDTIAGAHSLTLRLFRKGLVNSKVFAAFGSLATRLAAELHDPDVLTGYVPIQLQDGRYALLADDYPGVTLETIIDREAPLTPAMVVATLLRICDILAQAHGCGFAHGNLTPENVIVIDRTDREVSVKLADFGIASTIRAHNARALTAGEQAHVRRYDTYYAPELAGRGAAADERGDVFSVGALCYHMLSGWIPFTDAAIEGATAVYLTDDPRPLMVLNKELGIPANLERAMLTALERNPANRYDSIASLIETLQEVELDLSILPRPVGIDHNNPPTSGRTKRRTGETGSRVTGDLGPRPGDRDTG